MLHFLLGLALCIFIGERLWHYASAWRLHRAVRRSLQWPPPPPIEPTPVWLAAALVFMVVILGVALGSGLAPTPSAVVAAAADPDSSGPDYNENGTLTIKGLNRLLPPAPTR